MTEHHMRLTEAILRLEQELMDAGVGRPIQIVLAREDATTVLDYLAKEHSLTVQKRQPGWPPELVAKIGRKVQIQAR